MLCCCFFLGGGLFFFFFYFIYLFFFFQIPFVLNIYTNVLCIVRYFVHVIQIKHSLNQDFGQYTRRSCEFFALLIDLYKLQVCDTAFKHDPKEGMPNPAEYNLINEKIIFILILL